MKRKYGGKELAKVLIYYGIIGDVTSTSFSIICPFHDDVNPSMRIDLIEGSFFCFGCNCTGDALDFVKKANPKLSDLQSCILLEQILHSEEINKLQIKCRRKRKKQSRAALAEAHDYYYGLKTTDWQNVDSKEELEIVEYMYKRGFSRRALNVAKCKYNYNIAYPFIFPILDNGKFMGWVGRTMNTHVEKKRKYLYNDGFRKRDTLCGNYEENCIPVICEGFMDYLSLRTRGHVKNVVAILGWHISDEQVNKLKAKGITTVISALDNDDCGKRGTEYLKKFFNVIRFDYPQDKKDSGEMSEEEIKMALKRTRRAYNEN